MVFVGAKPQSGSGFDSSFVDERGLTGMEDYGIRVGHGSAITSSPTPAITNGYDGHSATTVETVERDITEQRCGPRCFRGERWRVRGKSRR